MTSAYHSAPTVAINRPQTELARLLDRLRATPDAWRTEQAYVHWVRRFILHHLIRHPQEMGGAEIEAFLTHLAVAGRVSASTQTQALCAILFLYKNSVLVQETCQLTYQLASVTSAESSLGSGVQPAADFEGGNALPGCDHMFTIRH